jgi:hypothetical protein
MMLSRRVVSGLVFFLVLLALPVFAVRRGDVGASQNGFTDNCPASRDVGVCEVINNEGTATLPGKDANGNPVTVTITLYNWGFYKCSGTSCHKQPTINHAVLDVVLTGTDAVGIESVVVKGVLSYPVYVSCGGPFGDAGIGCIYAPEPDGQDVQEPTPINASDGATHTRWDFGGIPPSDPPPPATPFDQLLCYPDGYSNICETSPLGEAVLAVTNSVAQNKLTTAMDNYLVTLTDGTQLGGLTIPAPPTKQVVNTNNTQATATVITTAHLKTYTDSSQAYPQINADGSEQYPDGFTPLPLTNPPPCNPTNAVTGETDNRTFRTAWYVYTAPSNGSITISTEGSSYDTLIYVFTGNASEPTVVSCDDDPPNGHTLQAYTAFTATKGTTYYIMVGETPTYQTDLPGTLTGYPLSVDGALYFGFQFKAADPKVSALHSLGGGMEGANPYPTLVGDASGDL